MVRGHLHASTYRVPTMDDSGVFNPVQVSYQYRSSPLWTLRAILSLPAPGTPGAPMGIEVSQPECMTPADLPKPVLIRPLSPHPRG